MADSVDGSFTNSSVWSGAGMGNKQWSSSYPRKVSTGKAISLPQHWLPKVFLSVSVSMCAGLERTSDPRELELQAAVSCPVGSGRARLFTSLQLLSSSAVCLTFLLQ